MKGVLLHVMRFVKLLMVEGVLFLSMRSAVVIEEGAVGKSRGNNNMGESKMI